MSTKTVWKKALKVTGAQTVLLPCDATVLCFQNQSGQPTIWFECSPDAQRNERTFVIVGTNHPTPSGKNTYVGTAQFGPFVWHLYEGNAK